MGILEETQKIIRKRERKGKSVRICQQDEKLGASQPFQAFPKNLRFGASGRPAGTVCSQGAPRKKWN